MSIVSWLYLAFNPQKECDDPDKYIAEANELLDKEKTRTSDLKKLVERAKKLREVDEFGEAFKRALGGKRE